MVCLGGIGLLSSPSLFEFRHDDDDCGPSNTSFSGLLPISCCGDKRPKKFKPAKLLAGCEGGGR
jgi:hypothetical protein